MHILRGMSTLLILVSLQSEMYHPSAEYSPSRPFKIFISLLDKWEIGSLLTDVLIYDALLAMQRILNSGEGEEDV